MAKILITGSASGLGLLTAQRLVAQNSSHQVYLHARSASRAEDAKKGCPEATDTFIADLSSLQETKALAEQINAAGPFDVIIHNAGLYRGVAGKIGPDGFPVLFAANTMAPYVLTCMINPPAKRMVFLSSSLHQGGDATLKNIQNCGYADSKLHNIMLAFGFARKFAAKGVQVQSNSLDPGWVATKMGGPGASDDIEKSVDTYTDLALDEGAAKGKTGQHWYHSREHSHRKEANDEAVQEKLFNELASISGVRFPDA